MVRSNRKGSTVLAGCQPRWRQAFYLMSREFGWYDAWDARLVIGFQMLNQEDDQTDFAKWLRGSSNYSHTNRPGGKILMSEHTEQAARAADEDPSRGSAHGGDLDAMVDKITRTPAQRPSDRSPGDIRRDGERLKAMFALKPIPEGHTNQARYLRNIREMGREFAIIIHENSPRCADQTLAVRCVREAVLWAQEAILREGLV